MVLNNEQRLRDLGARKFIVVGIGAIGCTPSQRVQNKSEVCNEQVNFWATKYNDGLTSVLKAFKSEFKDINYSYFDAYSVFVDFIQNPSTYGTKTSCFSSFTLLKQKSFNRLVI